MRLAEALSSQFTVYIAERRGRGASGPPGEGYGLQAECDDVEALLLESGARYLFGLSAGALVALFAARRLGSLDKVALYEPPLSIGHSTPLGWLDRYDCEVAAGKLGSAMLTAIRGTETAPLLLRVLPRALLAPVLDRGSRIIEPGTAPTLIRRIRRVVFWPLRRLAAGQTSRPAEHSGDVPLRELVPTMHYEAQLVSESDGDAERFRDVTADVLLLGGSESARYLRETLNVLGAVLPRVRRVEFAGEGHLAPDNSGSPERVATELRQFFGAVQQ